MHRPFFEKVEFGNRERQGCCIQGSLTRDKNTYGTFQDK